MENKVTRTFLLEELAVTGDTFLALMENTVLRHVPVGTLFQSGFFRRVCASLSRGSPDRCTGRGELISIPPLSPDLTSPASFFWGFVKIVVYREVVNELRENRQNCRVRYQ
jgi:hypothetical protein